MVMMFCFYFSNPHPLSPLHSNPIYTQFHRLFTQDLCLQSPPLRLRYPDSLFEGHLFPKGFPLTIEQLSSIILARFQPPKFFLQPLPRLYPKALLLPPLLLLLPPLLVPLPPLLSLLLSFLKPQLVFLQPHLVLLNSLLMLSTTVRF